MQILFVFWLFKKNIGVAAFRTFFFDLFDGLIYFIKVKMVCWAIKSKNKIG